jgi:hypothetical protein
MGVNPFVTILERADRGDNAEVEPRIEDIVARLPPDDAAVVLGEIAMRDRVIADWTADIADMCKIMGDPERRRLEDRNEAIRKLARAFYGEYPSINSRARVIAADLGAQVTPHLRRRPTTRPRDMALRKVLDLNMGKILDKETIRKLLSPTVDIGNLAIPIDRENSCGEEHPDDL